MKCHSRTTFLHPTIEKWTGALNLEASTADLKGPGRPIGHAWCWQTQVLPIFSLISSKYLAVLTL